MNKLTTGSSSGSRRKTKDAATICKNPATGESIGKIPVNSIEQVQTAVAKARLAQADWQNLPVKSRARYIKKIGAYIQLNADEIARTISSDNGKTLVDAMATEVVPAAMATDYYCKNAPSFLKDKKISAGNLLFLNKKSRVVRVPYGVIGIISPWNYPFSIPYSEVIMALLAGNAVMLKAASETQMTGQMLKKCVEAAGLPENLFVYINMPGKTAGDAFLDAGVDKLLFTGSVSVGKYLMQKASHSLTPVVLELGGNDPMIVCHDADLHRAAAGAVWAGMQNAGQSCGGVERVYVDRGVYREFLDILKKKIEMLRIGDGKHFNTDIGAMTTARQIDTVQKHIKDAVKKGAVVFAEAKVPTKSKGQFTSCVVLTGVTHEMLVMKEETFGPVLGVMPFDSIDEAVALANDSDLGLTASVWSKDRPGAMKIARRIQAGAVLINDHLMNHGLPETPWGGFKQSGIGKTHGEAGFSEMTQQQVIVNDLMPFARRNFWWHPFDRALYIGLKGVLGLLYGKGISLRMISLLRLVRIFLRTFTRR